jgi:hypothetical protein
MSSAKQPLTWSLLAVCAVTLCMFVSQVSAQDDGASIHVSTAEAYTSSNFNAHILPALTAAGKAVSGRQFGPAFEKAKTQARSHSKGTPTVPAPGFYPSDLDYFGGPVVTQMLSNPVYVNASSCGGVASCWGDPAGFLRDLANSRFIHVTDQYTGTSGFYGLGRHVNAHVTPTTNPNGNTVIDQPTLIAIAHDAAVALGVTSGGYNHEFHIFLPAGIDTCFPGDSVCYSPDNPATFFFCAYHGSVVFSDIGHVMLSVQPYQNVPGCQAAPPNPNGMLADSTNSVLSHETIETITDPDGDAWIAGNSLIVAGAEIGDLCEPTGNDNGQFLFSYLNLNGNPYELQLEYSNRYHACASQ